MKLRPSLMAFKKKETPKEEKAETAKTVRMYRDGKTADVHPDEVSNYSAYGWSTEQPK